MNDPTPTTTLIPPIPESLQHLDRYRGPAFIGLAVVLGLAVVWRLAHRGPAVERWHRHPGTGRISGPWLARARVRRALQPLVELVKDQQTHEAWTKAAGAMTVRQGRRLTKLWPHVAAALDWECELWDYSVDPTGRYLYVVADTELTDLELTKRLWNLGVLAHTSRATSSRLDDAAGVVLVYMNDATGEAQQQVLVEPRLADRDLWLNGNEGVTSPTHRKGDVLDWTRIVLDMGTRWTSVHRPEVTWVEHAYDTDDEGTPAGADIGHGDPAPSPSPDGRLSPAHSTGGVQLTQPPGRQVSGILAGVRIGPGQRQTLLGLQQHPATGPGVRLTDLVAQLQSDRSNLHRTLSRLSRLGLVTRTMGADAQPRWALSDLGHQTLAAMGSPTPAPAPASAPKWSAPDPSTRSDAIPDQTVEA